MKFDQMILDHEELKTNAELTTREFDSVILLSLLLDLELLELKKIVDLK